MALRAEGCSRIATIPNGYNHTAVEAVLKAVNASSETFGALSNAVRSLLPHSVNVMRPWHPSFRDFVQRGAIVPYLLSRFNAAAVQDIPVHALETTVMQSASSAACLHAIERQAGLEVCKGHETAPRQASCKALD